METGWIKLHRKIKKNNLWLKKPSTWTKIFIYILTEVNHETGEGFFNFTQDRKNIGCDITPDIIKKCIATLRQMKILSTTRSTRGMVVKVLNYASYQTVPSKTSTSPSTTEAREKHDRSTTINKKVRSKEDKNIYIGFSFLEDNKFNSTYKDFLEMRKKMRKPLTNRAEQIILNKLHAQDIKTATQMLEDSIEHNWLSVYFPKEGPKPEDPLKYYNDKMEAFKKQSI